MKLGTYVIGQGDSIETLAQILLGDVRQAETLIKINNLRYPYISDDPVDQFANQKGVIFISQSYVNPSSIEITNPNAIVILNDDTIVFSEGSNFGSGIVQNVTGGTSIAFKSPVVGTFDAGAIVRVFSNQQNINTQVLRTGDTLFYPFDGDATTTAGNPNDYQLVLGTDWKLDENMYLVRGDRDIATVSGFENIFQATKMRIQTAIGKLFLHPYYGNKIYNALGEGSNPHFAGLAKHYLTECVLQDNRIETAKVSSFSLLNDQMFFTLSIQTKGSQNVISQPVTIKLNGGYAVS